jgi:hypothetical protein
VIARGYARDTEKTIPAHKVKQEYECWLCLVRATAPVTRAREASPVNQGLADQTALRESS